MKTTLIAVGKIKGPEADLAGEYAKRLQPPLVVRELQARTQKAEGEALLKALPAGAFLVLLDERGKDVSSRDLAVKIKGWQESGASDLVFMIGGADGFADEVRERANFVLGLGAKTWPHMLARVLLIEQLYRAQQINAGHPYHRD